MKELIGYLLKGEIVTFLISLSHLFPVWLLRFNRAYFLGSDKVILPKQVNPEVLVSKATADDAEAISAVNEWTPKRNRYLLESRAICYIGSIADSGVLSVGWSAFGKCYVRGLGWKYDFGTTGHYTFGLITLLAGRKKGLNSCLVKASIDHAIDIGVTEFYSIVEHTNPYALVYHEKMGFDIYAILYFIKLFGIRISWHRSRNAKQRSVLRIFTAEPEDCIII